MNISTDRQRCRTTLIRLRAHQGLRQLASRRCIQEISSLSRIRIALGQELRMCTVEFTHLGHSRLRQARRRTLRLLSGNSVRKTVHLCRSVRASSILTRHITKERTTSTSIRLLLPSLIRDFRLVQRANSITNYSSITHLVLRTAQRVTPQLAIAR